MTQNRATGLLIGLISLLAITGCQSKPVEVSQIASPTIDFTSGSANIPVDSYLFIEYLQQVDCVHSTQKFCMLPMSDFPTYSFDLAKRELSGFGGASVEVQANEDLPLYGFIGNGWFDGGAYTYLQAIQSLPFEVQFNGGYGQATYTLHEIRTDGVVVVEIQDATVVLRPEVQWQDKLMMTASNGDEWEIISTLTNHGLLQKDHTTRIWLSYDEH
jgi:hypothetical protein